MQIRPIVDLTVVEARECGLINVDDALPCGMDVTNAPIAGVYKKGTLASLVYQKNKSHYNGVDRSAFALEWLDTTLLSPSLISLWNDTAADSLSWFYVTFHVPRSILNSTVFFRTSYRTPEGTLYVQCAQVSIQ